MNESSLLLSLSVCYAASQPPPRFCSFRFSHSIVLFRRCFENKYSFFL